MYTKHNYRALEDTRDIDDRVSRRREPLGTTRQRQLTGRGRGTSRQRQVEPTERWCGVSWQFLEKQLITHTLAQRVYKSVNGEKKVLSCFALYAVFSLSTPYQKNCNAVANVFWINWPNHLGEFLGDEPGFTRGPNPSPSAFEGSVNHSGHVGFG